MIAEKSISVLSNMLDDIKKFWFGSLIVFQSIFIVFYLYSIFKNLNNLIFVITYSILFILSITSFVIFLKNHYTHRKQHRKLLRHKNFLKYFVNLIMIIVNIIELTNINIDTFGKILLIVSSFSLLIQVSIELIKIFAEKYFSDLKDAFEKDFGLLNIKNWKSNSLKIIDAPLEKLASLKEKNKPTKEDIKIDKHLKRYKERKAHQNEINAIKKIEKRSEAKKQEDLRVHKEINELKSHIKTILTKTENKEKNNKEIKKQG